MATEQKGFPVDISKGTHTNTEYKDNKIVLTTIGLSDSGVPLYATYGMWVSEITDLVDRYTSLENLAIGGVVLANSSSYKAYTRTSSDGVTWEDYMRIDATTGKMMSTKNRYIQVKVEFEGMLVKIDTVVERFDKNESTEKYKKNNYIEVDEGLKLRREYDSLMTMDATWTEDGYLFRKVIEGSELKKIDSLTIK